MVAASLAGLMASVAIERLLRPKPPIVRPWAAWGLHAGLWLVSHSLLTLLLGRPWFAAAAVLALLLTLVLVNNAKLKALREPFVFQDYEYFTDAIRHPRLYIPFLGWWKFLGAAAGFMGAIVVGFWGEPAPADRFAWQGQLAAIGGAAALGLALLVVAGTRPLPVSFRPDRDILALGFLACLWRYGEEERRPLGAASPFDFIVPRSGSDKVPHLIAVQSESFFDPRSLFSGIRSDVLAHFDQLKAEAASHGRLSVPAWGANTVRSEFAFLAGIGDDKLGVHRFNPYRAVAAGLDLPSLASFLKGLGYRTVCVHPYPASFYQRNRVSPRLGFEEFVDIRGFDRSLCFGPYIGDAAVADKIADIIRDASGPVFVFAITMENHGPLHLEQVQPADIASLYSAPPPAGCDDLTIYLRHLRNADKMTARLQRLLKDCDRAASLCWFGDHVPIMPTVYETFGSPSGDVEYVIWHNWNDKPSAQADLPVSELGVRWLGLAGLFHRIDAKPHVHSSSRPS